MKRVDTLSACLHNLHETGSMWQIVMSLPRSPSLAFLAHAVRAERPAEASYVVAGRFNLTGIMREAVKLARQINARHGFAWARRMAIGLRTVWGRAKAAMASASRGVAMMAVPSAPARPAQPRATVAHVQVPRARTWLRGSRIHSHGW